MAQERVKEYTTSIISLHWIHFVSLVVLTITGLYIAVGGVMGTMRIIHFIFAYVLTFDIIIRTYVAFFSKEKADWREFVPDMEDVRLVIPTLKHYVYSKKYKHVTDRPYNPIQKLAYLAFFVLVIFQIITGFALYPAVGGNIFGIPALNVLAVPVQNLLGGLTGLRLVHYIVTLGFILFTGIHIYMAVWTDLYEKNEIFRSIFTGYKLKEH